MLNYTTGDLEGAAEEFSKLQRRQRQVDIVGVNLSIPDEVPLIEVELAFLQRLLQIISENNGDTQVVYSFLAKNVEKLNEHLAEVLRLWATNLLKKLQPDEAQLIATYISNFSILLTQFPLGYRARNIEIAITGYEIVLTVFTREVFPKNWAGIQALLGNAYRDRISGNKAENLEQALTYFLAALQIFTHDDFPQDWALTQISLGEAYINRIQGNKAENLEQAIASCLAALQILTHDDFPQDWAGAQINLGIAYINRILGEKAENLENAIAACTAALTVRTHDAFPIEWAATQNALGIAYINSIRGDKADNLENAIAACTAALTVRTKEALPIDWAETQNNLATAYRERILGEKTENIENAIAACTAALTVYTREALPVEWARTQNNLATAYRERIKGNRAENIEMAIATYSAALQVYTRESFPYHWAITQNNLGTAYRDRILGERAENIELAIAAFFAALEVRTRDALPYDWAETQNNLGTAYRNRIRGDRAENIEMAIAAYQAALMVYTREAFPQNHAENLCNLGIAYQKANQLTSAYNTFQSAIATVESLREEIISGEETKRKQAQEWNKLYCHMVEVCLDLSNITEAIEYVERIKTRNLVEQILERDYKTIFPPEVVTQLEKYRDEIATGQYQIQNGKAENPQVLAQHLQGLRQQRNELQNGYLPVGFGFKFDSFRSTLNDRTAIVEFYITNDKLLVFIITKQTQQPITLSSNLVDLNKLANWANSYLKAYSHKKSYWQRRLTTRLHLLAKILHIDEILTQIPNHCDQLILIPHMFLHLFPLHALPVSQNSENSPCLLDLFAAGVSYAPSCQLLQQMQKRQRPEFSKFFAIQNPNQNLSWTNIEVENIKQYFSNIYVLEGKAATKQAVMNQLHLPLSAHCIHFSANSYFDFNFPLKSALILADADNSQTIDLNKCLTLEEIFNLNLSECRLVTLSASETALTDLTSVSNEYMGFPSAFLVAGSVSVVASFWGVNDLSTALLMIRFYKNLQQMGTTIAVALNEAQRWLREVTKLELQELIQGIDMSPTLKINLHRRFYKLADNAKPFWQPFYWAAFSVIGA
ncbi:CHAT domain-containing protein [Nostoc sp. FACHB-87]|nr:CHAT domain-containing protein [Nostoc sp. FACHB-87]MBD2478267.1 CHAT domain-containing protein [Anabaena sp. FACHB-83]